MWLSKMAWVRGLVRPAGALRAWTSKSYSIMVRKTERVYRHDYCKIRLPSLQKIMMHIDYMRFPILRHYSIHQCHANPDPP